jgi:hypothetical protein
MELVDVDGKIMHADQELAMINQQLQLLNVMPFYQDAKLMEVHVSLLKHAQISMEINNIVKNHKLDHVCILIQFVMITHNAKMYKERLIQFVRLFHHYVLQMEQIVFQLLVVKKPH